MSLRGKKAVLFGMGLALVLVLAPYFLRSGPGAQAQTLPPFPSLYAGSVTVAGQPGPEGYKVFGRVEDYESTAATISGGGYSGLTVVPAQSKYVGKTITFWLDGPTPGLTIPVQAAQTDLFSGTLGTGVKTLNLTFPALPALAPTPTPTPTPTATPIPKTVPWVYTGQAWLGEKPAPEGLPIKAKVDSYESSAIRTESSGRYRGLTVWPPDYTYDGKTIRFYLGVVPALESDVYRIADGSRTLEKDLHFPDLGSLNVGDPSVTRLPVLILTLGLALLVAGVGFYWWGREGT